VSDAAPSSALRQIRRHLGSPRVLGFLALVTGVAALTGPFGTITALSLWERVLYWAAIVGPTYAIGTIVSVLAEPPLSRALPDTASKAALGVLIGLTVVPVVMLVNGVVFGDWRESVSELVYLGVVAVVLSVLVAFFGPDSGAPATPPGAAPAAPRLLSRLPVEKRGRLRALSAEDHYVRIRTEAGEALVLMRLTDAIAEAAPEPGLRIHRSHWVATAAATRVTRTGETAEITLADGTVLPVSRANVPALRKAGLLPVRAG